MAEKQRKIAAGLALAAITLLAAGLRLYRHHDLLHFQLDQARDMAVVDGALTNGFGELPLLGPRAGGTMVRLGPIFYYFLYLFGLLFGNSPDKVALYDAFFSILTVPLLYLFLRLRFTRSISLLVALVGAVSLFAVVYGRFSWNPNTLPFFTILLLYSLARSSDRLDARRNWFIYGAAASLAVAIQLHFLAFIALPVVTIAFLLALLFWPAFSAVVAARGSLGQRIKKGLAAIRKISLKNAPWKHIMLSGLLFIFLNAPAFTNEYLTGGDNTKQFMAAIGKKSEKEELYSGSEKLFRAVQEYARGYYLVLTGNQQADVVDANFTSPGRSADFICDQACRDGLPYLVIAVVMFAFGAVLFLLRVTQLFHGSNAASHLSSRESVLILAGLLFVVPFLGFLSLAYAIRPRFFLLTFAVPFFALGLFLEFVVKKIMPKVIAFRSPAAVAAMPVMIVSLLVVSNAQGVFMRLKEQAHAFPGDPARQTRDLVLGESIRITLQDEKAAARWIAGQARQKTVYVWAPPEYYRPMTYLLRKIEGVDGRKLGTKPKCRAADYFALVPMRSPESFLSKVDKRFSYTEEKAEIGSFIVYKLQADPAALAAVPEECRGLLEDDDASDAERYTIKEVFRSE